MLTVEQLTATQQANLDTVFGLVDKTFASVEKLVSLQIATAKTALAEASEASAALLSAKDPQELYALQVSYLQPATEKAASYGRQVYDISTETASEFVKVFEAQAEELKAKLMAAVDASLKNAPPGSETAVSLMKSTLTAANDAIENANKAAKQAVAATEANLKALATTAAKVAPVPAVTPAKGKRATA